MNVSRLRVFAASLALFFCMLAAGCGGDKPTSATTAIVPPLEPYSLDSLAVRIILDTNGLTHIPVGEPYAKNIVVIDPVKKDTTKRIGELWLSGKNMTILPKHIGQLSKLTVLQLDTNAIVSLPAEIGNCIALTIINVSNNKLTGLPSEIGKLDSLRTLELSHNALASIPEQVGNLKFLVSAWFDFNALTTLPATISALSNLQRLALNNNSLSELPVTMDKLPRIYLTINNNKLCTLTDDLKKWLNDADQGWDATQNCP